MSLGHDGYVHVHDVLQMYMPSKVLALAPGNVQSAVMTMSADGSLLAASVRIAGQTFSSILLYSGAALPCGRTPFSLQQCHVHRHARSVNDTLFLVSIVFKFAHARQVHNTSLCSRSRQRHQHLIAYRLRRMGICGPQHLIISWRNTAAVPASF